MGFAERLTQLDRRWIFLVMGLLVLFPLLFPLALPLTVTPPVRNFAAAVDGVPEGSLVLMSCDYDPGAIPELVPMTRTAFRHLLSKNCRVVVTGRLGGPRRAGENIGCNSWGGTPCSGLSRLKR